MVDLSMVDECCPFCEAEVEIPVDKVSKCPNCGREMFPCATCDVPGLCDWSSKTFGCHKFARSVKEVELLKTKWRR
jgi:hypothetical protein